MKWVSLISSGHSIQMQKNTLFLKCTWNILQDLTTSRVTNETSVNLRKWKFYQASFLTML